jgi:hypothetical protein
MSVAPPRKSSLRGFAAPVLIGLGALIAVGAWMMPVNLKAVSLALLRAAGEGTPTLGGYGRDLVDVEKIGPAALVLAAAQATHDPRAPALQDALAQFAAREPGLIAWGGWDPFLDPLFNLRATPSRGASVPVVRLLLPEKARATLRDYLNKSGSSAVQSLLKLRDTNATGRFVPATRPGGQPLETVILLTGLLYQGGHVSATLQRELRALVDIAAAQHALGDLEGVFLDLLSLGQRLDWGQLVELMRRTDSTKTLGHYAHLARVTPDKLALIYAAALFSDSADRVASYLLEYGRHGLDDLTLALGFGQGAVRQLLVRQVPVNRTSAPVISAGAEVALTHPQLILALKYLGYFAGVWLVLLGLDRLLVAPAGLSGASAKLVHMRAGVLSLVFALIVVAVTEPFLLRAAPVSEFRQRVHLALDISNSTLVAQSQPVTTMAPTNLITIAVFAALQIAVYFICLLKIREVARQPVSPLVKLRLMENEENLFDMGLYVGIGGTAAAMVLITLGLAEANLLAAFSSNLFGITCVALVKIRHVRPFKRQLILEGQVEASPVREPNEPAVRSARGATAL